MRYLGEDIAKEHGYTDSRGYTRGTWVTWRRTADDGRVWIHDIFNDESDCLRSAVTRGLSVTFVPFGHGYDYIDDADTDGLPMVDKPAE